jgi:hypothetical protein
MSLSVSQCETIGALCNGLRVGRAQSVSFQEIREAEQQFVPLQIDVRGSQTGLPRAALWRQ